MNAGEAINKATRRLLTAAQAEINTLRGEHGLVVTGIAFDLDHVWLEDGDRDVRVNSCQMTVTGDPRR